MSFGICSLKLSVTFKKPNKPLLYKILTNIDIKNQTLFVLKISTKTILLTEKYSVSCQDNHCLTIINQIKENYQIV